jgi:hypothetical protein
LETTNYDLAKALDEFEADLNYEKEIKLKFVAKKKETKKDKKKDTKKDTKGETKKGK